MKNKLFLVALIATIFVGCKTDEPEEQPIAQFSYVINDKTVTFTNQSQHAQKYFWTFGDGATSAEANPVKTYARSGTYRVALEVTNISKKNTYEESIVISDAVKAKFSFVVDELKVTFTNQSSGASSYSWNFGNGQTSTQTNPTITYGSAGTYSVKLTAKQGDKTDTYTQSVTVNYKQPSASFTYKVEQPLKVVLTNTSQYATSYTWDFGDGTTSTEKSPTHRYNGIGVYKIKLTAKNNNISKSYETNVTIEAPTTCYMSSFTITKIPTNNCYYQLQLTDDYVLSKTTYFYTDWYLLSSANIPYSHTLKTQKQIDLTQTYVMRLYKSTSKTSGQASGKGDYTYTITPSQLKKYPEIITWSATNVGLDMYFIWK